MELPKTDLHKDHNLKYKDSYVLNSTADLDPLMERIGDASCVMLGEASHGTHEYYSWRTAITKRLILEKGFSFIAVEGDWPDCYRVNRYIKGFADKDKTSTEILQNFRRWPTWMWANWEIDALVNWLKAYNLDKAVNNRIGFYGLDVYSLWESMEAMETYLRKNDPGAASIVHEAMRCFEAYEKDEEKYARAQYFGDSSCRNEVIRLLTEVRKKTPVYDHDPEAALNIEQNAFIAVNAEKYYSNMVGFGENTWNLRDQHMMDTLFRLTQFHGPDSKAIVWEHNTHIGDARYTDMALHGMHNTGQLARQQFGESSTVLVGFGSYQGSVIAGAQWDAPMEIMEMPAAREGSVEHQLHKESAENKLLIFDSEQESGQDQWSRKKLHRAIGVVYDPKHEKRGNYVPTVLSRRYDAFLYLDQTTALHPMHLKPDGSQMPETYPFTF
ncbi:erythromycin esterase family protein [Dyadobacter flavalbus]|uniref:Erythromycin esterase family protein n=1 Tax=Dyadobacter flavalbus TaxID=2579942 RepID=A0A5M8QYN6_9BACT|nr:erythromycin esterase family protein [Dyadobacter flavalbus]KAA6439824.1 erythromycin esterase family protein [Dyadobacter flavalbus]